MRIALARCLLASFCLSIASVCAFAQSTVDATYTQAGLGSMVYRIYIPDGYQPSGPDKTPVVLYLHSAAERGNNVDEVFINPHGQSGHWVNPWINYLVDETQTGDHKAVLIIPQSGLGQVWNSMTAGDNWGTGNYTDVNQKPIGSRLQLAMNILDSVTSNYNVDTNRLYVTGASMGGYGTWDAIARFPDKFAAAMPVAGAGNTTAAATYSADVPVWAYHGATDSLIPTANSDQLYFTMKQAGAAPLYSRAAGQGHSGFDLFYNPGYYTTTSQATSGGSGDSVYDWLFSQSLDQRPTLTPPASSRSFIVDINGAVGSNSSADYVADGSELIAYNRARGAGSVLNLKHPDGSSSDISLSFVSGTVNAINNNAAGLSSGIIAELFPDSASRGFLGTTSKTNPIIFRIDGLDDSATYTFDIFSSRTGTGTRNSLFIADGLNSVSGEINCINNYDTFLTLAGLQPLNGSITITCMPGTGNTGYAYFNALQITEVLPIPEPASLSLLALGALMLLRRRNA